MQIFRLLADLGSSLSLYGQNYANISGSRTMTNYPIQETKGRWFINAQNHF